jgi:hypothetical protein
MPFGGDQVVMSVEAYEVRQRSDKRGVDLVFDALPFSRLWYGEPNAASNAMGYAKFYSRSHDPVIRVYDDRIRPVPPKRQRGQSESLAQKAALRLKWRDASNVIPAVMKIVYSCNEEQTDKPQTTQQGTSNKHARQEKENQKRGQSR